jgi:hypothetical protein
LRFVCAFGGNHGRAWRGHRLGVHSMAHIVPFRTTTARGAEEAEAGRAEGAQIVIFPGVRRERHTEPPAGQPCGATDAKRDWLELPDELPAACP